MSKKISIVIPCYNESENIIYLLKNIRKYLNCKIFIVDDSLNNLTKKIIKKEKFNNVLYYHRKKKLGRGSAVIFGFKKALNVDKKKLDCIIEMDADMSHHPKEIGRHLKLFFKSKSDLLIASRYLKKSKINNWPVSRMVMSKLSNVLARFLLGIDVCDYTNGYRFYTEQAANIIINKTNPKSSGFIILSEIILIIKSHKLKITENYTTFNNRVRGESSVNLKLILDSFLGLLKLFFLKILGKF